MCKEQSLRTTNQTCTGYCHGGGIGWADSFAVNMATHGKVCYCKTTFDHGIGEASIGTPAGCKNMRQVCQDIEDKYGPAPVSGRQYYNSIQCGHPPYNRHDGFPDELPPYCPGRVDDGGKGCQDIGPAFDLNAIYAVHVTKTPRAPDTTASNLAYAPVLGASDRPAASARETAYDQLVFDMTKAAVSLVVGLSPSQQKAGMFSFDSDERTKANMQPFQYAHKNGLKMSDVGPQTRSAVLILLGTGLSAIGKLRITDTIKYVFSK